MKLVVQEYPGIPHTLFEAISTAFDNMGYEFERNSLRGALFVHITDNTAVLIDHLICDRSYPFSYTEYTKEQNALMHQYRSLYRFTVDDEEEQTEAIAMLNSFRSGEFCEDDIRMSGRNRELAEVDPTIPEAYFERTFIETYGRESLDKVQRECPVIDINGSTRWIDYRIRRGDYDIAVEKNGEVYHHPITTGKKQYNSQLIKQNSLVAYGMKVFRWSIKAMQFSDNFSEEMRHYLGDESEFIVSQKLSVSRNFKLFDHQDNILDSIQTERNEGRQSFLVVLPTGTGKTEVLMADVAREYHTGSVKKVLVLVPGKDLKYQIIDKFKERNVDHELPDNLVVCEKTDADIVIQTYAWMSRYYQNFDSSLFDYVAVDEAHHAVAPTVQKVIQHFNPKTLIGLTATDKRLDTKKLEDVFGKYETGLTLVEAIKQNLLAPIKAFRVKSSIDLSKIRFNGKDYMSTDLQKTVVVPSRDQLVVDLLLKYFVDSAIERKQGIVFCVSVKHAKDMAKRMTEHGIAVKAVSGNDNKSASYIQDYQDGKLQFLTTCSLLNEGWDSPQTSVIVMARPTMSQVLYTQQLGRGTRKHPGKDALYVVDVVDNYGGAGVFTNRPWSVHGLLGIPNYMPWADVLGNADKKFTREELLLAGLYEEERKLEKIDIFTFEREYPEHLSEEQLARELFVSTGTIKSWIKKKKVEPDVIVPVGKQKLSYFAPHQIDEIITTMKLKRHDETTQYDDFFEFVDEGDYSMSYKIIMMLSMLSIVDHNGECCIDDLLDAYISFYRERLERGIAVDRGNCPYSKLEMLDNRSKMKTSLLQNPFEKFERKRFMYHCKDLNHIAFSNNLWNMLQSNNDIERMRQTYFNDLLSYYEPLDGVPNESELRERWGISTEEVVPQRFELIEFPEVFDDCIPLLQATGGALDLEVFIGERQEHKDWIKLNDQSVADDMFAVQVIGHSMEPKINDGDYCLFRAGSALAGSRSGRIVLAQHHNITDPDTTDQFTVKQYQSEKVNDEYGNPQHTSITLKPLNPDYDPIVIDHVDEESEFRIIAEFVAVL